ncbi:hypothetical protein [Saccharopolyspora phatthalungensis]|nr:hypothetical protein [Saccharopolyspora phatthalungensis]
MRTGARALAGLMLAASLALGVGGVAFAAVNDSLGVAATQQVIQLQPQGNGNGNPGNSGGNTG